MESAIHLFESAEVELLDSPDFSEAILGAGQVLRQEIPLQGQAPDSPWDGSDDGPWTAASLAWSSGTAIGGEVYHRVSLVKRNFA